jgi:superfamily II DNA/RNA helicase
MSFELNNESLDTTLPAIEQADTSTAPAAAKGTNTGEEFAALGLAPEIVRAIVHGGYEAPTAVQARAVPAALTGKDQLVSSQTGSGKTAAFVWPALQRILDARNDPAKRRAKGAPTGPRVLVLAPTRELALQVSRACTEYGHGVQGLRVAHVVGGVPYHAQLKALRGPLDVLIATPGRLLDLMNSGAAIMSQIELLVLDEADRMLDMGFIDDITAVAKSLPEVHQTMMFSATFDGHVGQLAKQLTTDAQRISVDSHTDTHSAIEQRLHWADSLTHKHALLEQILTDREIDQCVIFTSTQQDADALAYKLGDIGHSVAALHGGMPQGRRNRVLQDLRLGRMKVLVATDVAARGIDVPTITHVINYGLPMKAEDYVHRIGRTGRAGRNGLAITLAERRDVGMIRRIERFTTQPIGVAVVAGLEPKMSAPVGGGGGSFGGRPSFGRGPKPGFGGGNRGGFGGNGGGGYGGNGGGFNRGGPREGGFDRGDSAPRQDAGFDRGAPRHPGQGFDRGAPRQGFGGGFDRGAPRQEGFDRGAPRTEGFDRGAPRHEGFDRGAPRHGDGPRPAPRGPGAGFGGRPSGPRRTPR